MSLESDVKKVIPLIKKRVNRRLKELSRKKSEKEWFSELCFCLLTSNSKASTALAIQKEMSSNGFLTFPKSKISQVIRKNKHRFHNIKAGYIVEARKHAKIKEIVMKSENPREWLVDNVKGLGMKESSHFLRNVGYFDYAILDRHIINLLVENGLAKRPKTMNKKNYLHLEGKLAKIAERLGMNQGELDFYLWYMKTGEILK